MNKFFGVAAYFRIRAGLALSLAFALVFAMAPAQAFAAVERSVYIVQIQPGTDNEVRKAIASMGETPLDELDYVLDGFTLSLTALEAEQLALNPAVISVAPDEAMSLFDVDSPTKSWGLDRLDQLNTTFDNSFTYPSTAGAGVRIYIADTGVQANHPDLAGRVLSGFDTFGQGLSATDCHGHGTHVSGTAAGTQFGVAKQALIVPVRVLGCNGSGSYSGLITALDWIVANHPAGTPGIVSMSLGGPKSPALNAALEKVNAAGILTVVAAGNSNLDACTVSPASTPSAITVGASTNTDARASFSNFGECVDMFAPGAAITSDNAKDFGAPLTWNGTSMATPHVSGAAALYLSKYPAASPAEVTSALKQNGQSGVISNSNTPNGNILLNTSFLNTPEQGPIAGAPNAPAAPIASAITREGFTLTWQSPSDGGSPITGYKVEYRGTASPIWSSVSAEQTFATIAGLTPTTGYQVRVSAVNAVGTSSPSPVVLLVTAGDPPATPTGLAVYANWGFGTQFTWNPVSSTGANPIKGYRLELLKGEAWVEATYTTSKYGVIGGLTPMTTYTMRLMAVNNWGVSAPTAPFSFRTSTPAPKAITGLAAAELTHNTAKISWNPVARTVDSVPISYVVTYGRSGTSTPIQTINVSDPVVQLTGLLAKTSFWVSVKALSDQSSSATVSLSFLTSATVPSAPYFGITTRVGDKLNLTWATAQSGGEAITGYLLQRLDNGVWVDVAEPTTQSFDVPRPARASSATYRVAARNSVGLSQPSAAYTVNTPADLAAAPTGLTVSSQTFSSATLTWQAPSDNGGAAVTSYVLMRSTNAGQTWVSFSSVTSATANVSVAGKGLSIWYKVAARNSSGTGIYSEPIKIDTPLTVPSAPASVTSALAPNYKLAISWRAPSDLGGTPLTGYIVQKLVAGNWIDLASVASSVLALEADRDAMGSRMQFRVVALNAVGQSLPFTATALTVPYDKASAPTGLTATSSPSTMRTTLNWLAPASNGGSAISSYNLQFSTDNGATWKGLATAGTTSINIASPIKGVPTLYRVSANTLGGNGALSDPVQVSLDKTVPSNVQSVSAKFATDGSITVAWLTPADNGGEPITGYRIETLVNAVWQQIALVGPNVRSQATTKGQPGEVQSFRVFATNVLGESLASSPTSITVPLVRAEAPTGLKVDTATRVGYAIISWSAPTYLGGAKVPNYYCVEYSDNLTTWSRITSTALSVTSSAPAKGVTRTYRVYAQTLAGAGATSEPVSVTTAATAPSAVNWISAAFAADGTMLVKWAKPYENGGSQILTYVVQKQVAGVWSIASEHAAEVFSASFARESAGALVAFKISAKNAIGSSVGSRILYLQTPFLQASEVLSLSVRATSTTRATLSWLAPTSLGGGSVSRYNIEYSADNGATWRLYYTSSTTSYSVQAPPKGVTWLYRVSAQTQWGPGLGSIISYKW